MVTCYECCWVLLMMIIHELGDDNFKLLLLLLLLLLWLSCAWMNQNVVVGTLVFYVKTN